MLESTCRELSHRNKKSEDERQEMEERQPEVSALWAEGKLHKHVLDNLELEQGVHMAALRAAGKVNGHLMCSNIAARAAACQ